MVRTAVEFGRDRHHTADMLDVLVVMIVFAIAVFAWQDALAARELARRLSQRLCAEAGVQLLDQTVALRRFALARSASGWLTLRRWYSFDVSIDGHDRHRGGLRLLAGRLEDFSLPMQSAESSSGRMPH